MTLDLNKLNTCWRTIRSSSLNINQTQTFTMRRQYKQHNKWQQVVPSSKRCLTILPPSIRNWNTADQISTDPTNYKWHTHTKLQTCCICRPILHIWSSGRRAIYVFDLRDPFDERRNGNYGPTVRRAFIFFSKAKFSNLEAYKSRLARLKQSISLTAALSMSHKSANADAILRNWGPA
jgi:hypothetical protein